MKSQLISPSYKRLGQQLEALLDPKLPYYSNLANFSAFIFMQLENLNWVGCYLYDPEQQILNLGCFQGKPACTQIKPGHGVCGSSFIQNEVLVVDDVHLFDGHIACDAESNSEIVLPLNINGIQYGVIDIDSPLKARFSAEDCEGIQFLATILQNSLSKMHF